MDGHPPDFSAGFFFFVSCTVFPPELWVEVLYIGKKLPKIKLNHRMAQQMF